MEHANKQNEDYTDDDLNELMPLHFKNLARLENLDGDTVQLDEYLGSKSHTHGFGSSNDGRVRWRNAAMAHVPSTALRSEGLQQEAVPKQQARANNGWEMQEEANLNQNAGTRNEQENVPPHSEAMVFPSKPRNVDRGRKRQGTGRVVRRRTFGLDLKQLSLHQDGDDSEAEWEARDQELARQRAERSAQRRQEKESRQQRQSVGGRRQSIGPQGEDMELDSDDDDDDNMEDFDLGGGADVGWGHEEEHGVVEQGGSAEASAAWKTNPLFDGPQQEKQPAPKPETHTPLPPEPQPKATVSPISTQTTPPQTNIAAQTSFSAQAQKLAEQLLAKVGAAVNRAGAKSDGGTQTTPSLELLALEDRPRVHPPLLALPTIEPASVEKHPPSPAATGGDGSPLPQDVSAAMAMAAQVAEDIDFPALEGSPPPGNAKEGEQGPRKLAFGSPVDAGRQEGGGVEEEDPPEVLDDPRQEDSKMEPPPSEPAAAEPAPEESRAIVQFVRRKPAQKFSRLKSMLGKSRKSLAGAGLTIEKGIRRSTRVRVRPLQWWRNESYDWERLHDSLPTISRVFLLSPDPIWPRSDGRAAAKVKAQKAIARAKLPALTL